MAIEKMFCYQRVHSFGVRMMLHWKAKAYKVKKHNTIKCKFIQWRRGRFAEVMEWLFTESAVQDLKLYERTVHLVYKRLQKRAWKDTVIRRWWNTFFQCINPHQQVIHCINTKPKKLFQNRSTAITYDQSEALWYSANCQAGKSILPTFVLTLRRSFRPRVSGDMHRHIAYAQKYRDKTQNNTNTHRGLNSLSLIRIAAIAPDLCSNQLSLHLVL